MNSLPDLASFNKEEQCLVVLDDLVLEKNQAKIEKFYTLDVESLI